jgi:hypothetical protein
MADPYVVVNVKFTAKSEVTDWIFADPTFGY